MGKLSTDDVRKLARLSRLDLSEDELVELSVELSEILQYVERLQEIDVFGLQPTNQVTGLTNVVRKDTIKSYNYKSKDLLKNAPDVLNDQLKVKRMIG